MSEQTSPTGQHVGMIAVRHDERTLARFWEKVEVNEETGCMLWTASQTPKGYGQFRVGSKLVYAHRFSWELLHGPIPAGLQIDHLCRVRNCVNPNHLEPVDCRTNLLRGDTVAAAHAAKTKCPQGHPYDETNTYVWPNGGRGCRECRRQWDRERYRLRRGGLVT